MTTGYTYPIAEYFHYRSYGNAVTTGPVYRGSALPDLNRRLIISDFVNGVPYMLDADNLGDGGQEPITELRLRSGGVKMTFLAMIHQLNDFSLNSVVYYYPDPSNPGHYNTNGVRFFYVFTTGQVISK